MNSEFLNLLTEPHGAFLRHALWIGIIAAFPMALVGTYVVVKRITYIAAAIAHSILGGVGAAVYLETVYGWSLLGPGVGASAAALLSAWLIGYVSAQHQQREDTVIGVIWVAGMAIGLLFLAKTPRYFDPGAYLFGDILLVTGADLAIVAGLGAIILTLFCLAQRQIFLFALDPESAAIRGLSVPLLHYGMLTMTALTIFFMVRLVGIILVVALISLPPAIAALFGGGVKRMIFGAGALNVCLIFGGLWLSFVWDLPAGATIVILAASLFGVALAVQKFWRRA